MEKLIKLLKSNQAKAFYWTTLNGILSLVLLYLTDNNVAYMAILVPMLNSITKSINKKIKELNTNNKIIKWK